MTLISLRPAKVLFLSVQPEDGRPTADPSTEIHEKTVKYLTIGRSIWYKERSGYFGVNSSLVIMSHSF
jgi:hypothetical protein